MRFLLGTKIMKILLKSIKFIVLILAVTILTGCATPANYQAMIVRPTAAIPHNPKLKGAIEVVNVSGGKATNPLWTSQVDNIGFRKALEGSLDAYGYLASSSHKAKYKLDATLSKLAQPMLGFNLDVDSVIVYNITGVRVDKQYLVKASGTAKVSDAFVAVERLKIANERSIKENIKNFLKKLSSF